MVDKKIEYLVLLNALVLKAKMMFIQEGHPVALVTEVAIAAAWDKQEMVKIIVS